MIDYLQLGAFIVLAYMLGSIPTSVWIGKWFYNKDVRDHGSGNAGATNTIRVLGYKAGIPVLLFDIFKAWLAVFIASHFLRWQAKDDTLMVYFILIGMAAVIGHIFPLFAHFRGGKGVASLAGMALGLFPLAFLSSLLVFIVVVVITRYVSLGSIIAATSFPLFLIFIFNHSSIPLILIGFLASLFLIVTHRKNIKKLLNGTENKFGAKRAE